MKILFVDNSNDYDAMYFEDNYVPSLELWQYIKKGETLSRIEDGIKWGDLDVTALEFGEVDLNFIDFVKNSVCDYDELKHTNFYVVKE